MQLSWCERTEVPPLREVAHSTPHPRLETPGCIPTFLDVFMGPQGESGGGVHEKAPSNATRARFRAVRNHSTLVIFPLQRDIWGRS